MWLHPVRVIRINKMSCAFGKPLGSVARVHIGQVSMSICSRLQNKERVIEALHRAKFKFPRCQKIPLSKKWGFAKFNAGEFEDMVAEKWLIPDGCGVKYISNVGPLEKWWALHAWVSASTLTPTNKSSSLSTTTGFSSGTRTTLAPQPLCFPRSWGLCGEGWLHSYTHL